MLEPFPSEAEIRALVDAFESGTLEPGEFRHRTHLAVAAWYLIAYGETMAAWRFRDRVQHFVRRHDLDPALYNETLTRFWLRAAAAHAGASGEPRVQRVNAVLAALPDSTLVYRHYSVERLWSPEARRAWVEPDLEPLP